jgi:hypothetical protein
MTPEVREPAPGPATVARSARARPWGATSLILECATRMRDTVAPVCLGAIERPIGCLEKVGESPAWIDRHRYADADRCRHLVRAGLQRRRLQVRANALGDGEPLDERRARKERGEFFPAEPAKRSSGRIAAVAAPQKATRTRSPTL